jgi:peptidoglycan/LPS O-acetylase OafA/YrhL
MQPEHLSEPIGRLHWLDYIRGIASAVVCAAHTYNAMISPKTSLGFIVDRWMGGLSTLAVYLFFVVSGYSITLSILQNIRRNQGRFKGIEYASARLLRLYPPLILAILISMLVYWIITGFQLIGTESFLLPGDLFILRNKVEWNWKEAFVPLLFLQTIFVPAGVAINGSLWSLSFEFWFYVMAALLALIIINRSLVAAAILVLVMFAYSQSQGVRDFFRWYMLAWFYGGWLAIREQVPRFSVSAQMKWANRVLFSAVLVSLFAIGIHYEGKVFDIYIPELPSPLFYCLLSITLVLGFSSQLVQGFLHRDRVKPVMRYVQQSADFSYTLYIIHFPLLLLCMAVIRPHIYEWNMPATLLVAASIFVVLNVIAWKLSQYVENRKWIRGLLQTVLKRRQSNP